MSGESGGRNLGGRIWRRAAAAFLPWALPAALLLAWQGLSDLGWLPGRVLPAPSAVFKAAWRLAGTGDLWDAVRVSTHRAFAGFFMGAGIGLVLGLITGISRAWETALDSTVQMIRNVPHLAMIPLVILWFGIGEGAKIFLVVLGVFFPIYANTFHGVRSVDRGLREMARIYGLRGGRLFREVILPGALPSILVGIRYSLGFMWLTLIVSETIAATQGIGYITMEAREFMQTDVVVMGILAYALLGKAADGAARILERFLLSWRAAA